jgi:hypothetical protein
VYLAWEASVLPLKYTRCINAKSPDSRLIRGVTSSYLNKFSAHPVWLIQGGQAFISFAVCKSNYKADDFFEQYFVVTGLFGGE